jgi:hypothetical protein
MEVLLNCLYKVKFEILKSSQFLSNSFEFEHISSGSKIMSAVGRQNKLPNIINSCLHYNPNHPLRSWLGTNHFTEACIF